MTVAQSTPQARLRQEPEKLHPAALKDAARKVLDNGGRMQMVYAWYPKPSRIELRYVATVPGQVQFAVWSCEPDGPVPSLTEVAPLLSWYEREVTDLFGLAFTEHPQPQRLVLHDGAIVPRPPFAPDYPSGIEIHAPNQQSIPEIAGVNGDVQLLPFGPIRGDVLELAEFLFFYIGEAILHYTPRLFYKHRGMEKRFEGLSAERAVVLAERVSGVGSVAHALAYCQAVETAADCMVPPRARFLRVLLAEMERLYNHLYYLGHLCHTTTLKVGEAQGKFLAERAKQLNARLTGSRFLRSILTIGGLRRDLSPKGWLEAELESLRESYAVYARHLETTDSHLDRLITTGKLDRKVAFDQGATGPVDRASGLDRDLRRDHPYAAYGELPVTVAVRRPMVTRMRGLRFGWRKSKTALRSCNASYCSCPTGRSKPSARLCPASEGLGWSESPRGTLFYAVHFDGADNSRG